MSQVLYVDETLRDDILSHAGRHLTPLVLTHRVQGGWHTYKSRFLDCGQLGQRLVVEYPAPTDSQPSLEIVPGERLGLSFRRGHKKCLLAAEVLERCSFQHPDLGWLDALELHWPEVMQELQRRVYQRAAAPPGPPIPVLLWHGGTENRKYLGTGRLESFTGTLQDLSVGGFRVRMTRKSEPHFAEGDTVGCEFQPAPKRRIMLLNATFRHCQDGDDDEFSLGFQIVGLETTPKGCEVLGDLARVVSWYQASHRRRSGSRLPGRDRLR